MVGNNYFKFTHRSVIMMVLLRIGVAGLTGFAYHLEEHKLCFDSTVWLRHLFRFQCVITWRAFVQGNLQKHVISTGAVQRITDILKARLVENLLVQYFGDLVSCLKGQMKCWLVVPKWPAEHHIW